MSDSIATRLAAHAEWLAGQNTKGCLDEFGEEFSCTNLFGKDLRFARLVCTQINYSNLSKANLDGADMTGCGLQGSNLRGATLRNTNLSSACFIDADLTGADFTWAKLDNADFRGANLTGVIGFPKELIPKGYGMFDGAGYNGEHEFIHVVLGKELAIGFTLIGVGNLWVNTVLLEKGSEFWDDGITAIQTRLLRELLDLTIRANRWLSDNCAPQTGNGAYDVYGWMLRTGDGNDIG